MLYQQELLPDSIIVHQQIILVIINKLINKN